MTGLNNPGKGQAPGVRAAARSRFSASGLCRFLTTVLLPLLIAVGGTWTTNKIQDRDNHLEKERAAFIDEARTFDVVVANYVQSALSNNKIDSGATQQIISNIVRQNDLLDEASAQLAPQDRHIAKEYRHLLGEFREVIPLSDSVLHLKTFWEDASRILVVRNELIRKLQS